MLPGTFQRSGRVPEQSLHNTDVQKVYGGNDMKRKVLSVMLATAMTATLFAGCGSDASNADSANSADATASTTEAGDVKTDARQHQEVVPFIILNF